LGAEALELGDVLGVAYHAARHVAPLRQQA